MNMLFENLAASILQRIDRENDIDESVSAGPYYFNENYGKKSLQEECVPTVSEQDELANDEGAFLTKYIEIAARQILDGYKASKVTIQPEKLVYITDKDLLSAISRKTTQLHSLLKTCYNKDIAKEIIEQSIRQQIKYLAYNT